MELSDEKFIKASKEEVWAALNDPEVLRAAIPGCEEIERVGDTDYAARVVLKIGPVKARFNGEVHLDPSGAPDTFSLSGEGKGGAAGFAKGGADVTLAEEEGGTRLTYVARADVGGKIAQLGSRLIQSTARKLSAQFFDEFARQVEQRSTA